MKVCNYCKCRIGMPIFSFIIQNGSFCCFISSNTTKEIGDDVDNVETNFPFNR